MSILNVLDRPIAFNRAFVDLGVGITGALMLSQCVYWSTRTKNPDGWFYKTQSEWEEETGMNRREQERARKALKSIGVLEEKRRGVPARMYFRVNEDALEKALLGSPQALELADALDTYKSTLNGLSKTGLMRARKLGVKADYVDYSAVLKRDGMVCGCCQKPIVYGPGQHGKALSFDHKKPLAEGGEHVEDNLQPAHMACNVRKGGSEQSSLSTQDKLSPSTQEQTSLSTVDKQECLPKADKSALNEQTITEITAETTTETSGPNRAKRKTALPDGFKPNETCRSKAIDLGVSLEVELDKFTSFHQAKGNKYVDWQAAFRNWLTKAAEFRAQRGGNVSQFPARNHDDDSGSKIYVPAPAKGGAK
jgi:hypothetical protein